MEDFALITGASSGIGKALSREFAHDGYNLVVVSGNPDHLASAAEELQAEFRTTRIVQIAKDLTRPESPQEIFDELAREGIFVEALVNDAGVGHTGPFAEIPLEKEITIIRLNIEALTRLTKLFLPPMLAKGRGKILNLGSVAGFQPGPLLAVYHASKAFVVSLSEALAEELKDTNITVTCLCPGATATNFFDRAEMQDTRIVKHGGMMSPEDVAAAGYKALREGERIFVPGATNKILTFLHRVMPKSTQAALNKKFYESGEEEPAGRA